MREILWMPLTVGLDQIQTPTSLSTLYQKIKGARVSVGEISTWRLKPVETVQMDEWILKAQPDKMLEYGTP